MERGWFDNLSEFALSIGIDKIGIARISDLKGEPFYKSWLKAGFAGEMDYLQRFQSERYTLEHVLPGAKSVVMARINYLQAADYLPGQPQISCYALGRDYHKVLKKKLTKVEAWFREAFPNSQTRICVDSVPIPERELAQLAGLGWFGKNSCLIDSVKGSWFFIGGIITNVALSPSLASIGGCGTCTKCIDSCPTGAIVKLDNRWTVDARKCISYLTLEKRGDFEKSEATAIGTWTAGCDICQQVCPFNQPREHQPQRAKPTTEPDFFGGTSIPSLLELANFNYEQWDALSQGKAWRRAGYQGFIRNIKANIENLKPR